MRNRHYLRQFENSRAHSGRARVELESGIIMRHEQPNRHILVVDDNKAIHDDFLKILQPQVEPDAMSLTRSNLFA